MKIYHGLEGFKKLDNAVVSSGTFDGVHIGHQKILEKLVETAKKDGGESTLLTYWPHPRLVLYPEQALLLLSSLEEKTSLLKHWGIEHFVIIPFTKEFSEISSEDFIKNILVDRIGTRKLVIGYDHRFGNHRAGSFEQLKADGPVYGFEVEEIPKQMIDHVGISSTKIRDALTDGDIPTANEYLGRAYNMTGEVIPGDKIGRSIGFPTANMRVAFSHKLIPVDGIYAVTVQFEGIKYKGMLNIGFRPTFEGTSRRIEVHIFDFDQEIYGHYLTVNFHKRIRKEIKFANARALHDQLVADKVEVETALAGV